METSVLQIIKKFSPFGEAIIVCKKEKGSKKIIQILIDAINKHTNLLSKYSKSYVINCHEGIPELDVFILTNIFRSYRDFDGFLFSLVREHGFDSLEHNGLLLGHFDLDGWLWTDYF
ncbi:unnamed protein product [marine sediment metagenome]|uniref:Uncharacterized protein n=1 Tax=marine sediment metagenome TaxID=412755 RepID=X1Q6W0_9ZZZZ